LNDVPGLVEPPDRSSNLLGGCLDGLALPSVVVDRSVAGFLEFDLFDADYHDVWVAYH